MEQVATKPSAAYGHSCSNCVKAKCKCVPRDAGGSCERCHRLTKDCQLATFIRKRGVRKTVASSTRTSKLEDKLDSLVSLLRAQHAPPNADITATNVSSLPVDPQTRNLPSSPSREFDNSPVILSCLDPLGTARHVTLTPSTTSSSATSPPSDLQIPTENASHILSIFRSRFLDHFPFMHLPPSTPASQFQRERPMTFKAMCVACGSSWERQSEGGRLIREEIAKRVVAGGERSLDLLLASMVCMLWQIYFTRAKPDLGMFGGICRSLITDMRMVKSVQCSVPVLPRMPALYDLPEVGPARTDEDRRVLLTHYSLSAMLFMSLKHEPWRWAPQLEEHCRKLASNPIPGDQVLVAITRISRISVEAGRALQTLCEIPECITHVLLQIRSLQHALQQVQMNLAPELLQNNLVMTYLHCTKILVYETAIFPSPPPADPSLDFQRITFLTSCLQACKTTLETFNNMKSIHMNMPIGLAWKHAIQTLFKLSVLELPGWDRLLVRSTADVVAYFAKAVDNMEAADEELKSLTGGMDNVFTKTRDSLRSTVDVWREHMERYDETLRTEGIGLNGLGSFDFMDTSWLSFTDDVPLSSMLAW
ncbi:hypothetical protein P280DRAFT_465347 [Massarina eburnea CBS 473.64]|uniref:Zn(2)-C6 fungal-type domain-containing protein n=1 Tax=Massarina eburnea CBS 473.64 TaxID=1395130 RepID=A0A6A6SGF7_9PLEO|nr:hypothetical protein P280DRAFT_465347 [Massarina eburnea CBS 473.64]